MIEDASPLEERMEILQEEVAKSIPDGDLTKGHIDSIARFIGLRTVVVVQCTAQSLCQPGNKDVG